MHALFVCIYGQIREHQLSFSDGIGKNEKEEDPFFFPVQLRCQLKSCSNASIPSSAIKQPVSYMEQCRSKVWLQGTTVTQHPLQVQQQLLPLQLTVSTYLDKS